MCSFSGFWAISMSDKSCVIDFVDRAVQTLRTGRMHMLQCEFHLKKETTITMIDYNEILSEPYAVQTMFWASPVAKSRRSTLPQPPRISLWFQVKTSQDRVRNLFDNFLDREKPSSFEKAMKAHPWFSNR